MSKNLVLAPGLLCTSALYGPLIAALGDDYDLMVADNRGGQSMEAMAEGLLATAPPKFSLAGLSMGGFIAFEVLARAPDRVERLALLNTSARGDREEQVNDRRLMSAMAERDGIKSIVDIVAPICVHPSRLRDAALMGEVRTMMESTPVDVFVGQQNAIMTRRDWREDLGTISCPTLIIAGDEDGVTPPKLSREMADLIPGSKLEIIPDCGHLSTLERPEAVNGALRRWMES